MPTSSRNLTEPLWYVEWDRENNISPFNRAWTLTNLARADVGIGPYNETWGAFHSTGGTLSVSPLG